MKDYIDSPFIRTIEQREREIRDKSRLAGWVVFWALLAVMGWTAALVSVMSH